MLSARSDGSILVSCSGVGFRIHVPATFPLYDTGARVALWTHFRIRDDGADLYGFVDEDELALFESMQKIHGVSAKKALAVISHMGADGVRRAIAKGEAREFTAVPGIGKKLAQQFLLDMKGVIDESEVKAGSRTRIADDATLALLELGFKENDAVERVARVREENQSLTDTAEIVRLALKS